MDTILSLYLKSPLEIAQELAARARACRLGHNLTQAGLAKRSGVSLPSLKRFERTGQISLESLLKIALILDVLEDFEGVFSARPHRAETLDDLLAAPTTRRKGRIN